MIRHEKAPCAKPDRQYVTHEIVDIQIGCSTGFGYSPEMSYGLRKFLLLPATLAPLLASAHASAHILVTEPMARVDHDNTKVNPCGSNAAWGSAGVATFAPGEQITLRWDETILHPGYFRVVVSVTGDEALTMPSEADLDRFKAYYSSGSGDLPTPVEQPNGIEVDGLLVYYDYYAPHGSECAGTLTGGTCTYEVNLTLPVSCEQCTLQLVQTMAEQFRTYGSNAHYYHCVDFTLEGDVPTTDPSTDTTGDGTHTNGVTGSTTATGTTSMGEGGAGPTAGASTGAAGGSTAGAVGGAEPALPAPTTAPETPPPPASPPVTAPPAAPGSVSPPTHTALPAMTASPLVPATAGTSFAPDTMAPGAAGDTGGCAIGKRAPEGAALLGGWLLLAASLLLRRRAP